MNSKLVKPKAIIIIPARLEATRLARKPLADIHGKPMIVHCMMRALEEDIAPVIIAASDPEIAESITQAGGKAVLTDPDLPSGSDRIYTALSQIDMDGKYDIILNLQGDLPALPRGLLTKLLDILLKDEKADISTLASLASYEAALNPNMVKAVAGVKEIGQSAYALAFSRALVPWCEDQTQAQYLHHIGLYGWRREALKRFVTTPPSMLEKQERLEQMRALEMGMRIKIALVNACPAGVDTQEELEQARAHLATTSIL